MLKCNDELFKKLIGLVAGVGVVAIIAICATTCLCCTGCCACCGCLCLYLCKNKNKSKNQNQSARNSTHPYDSDSIPPINPVYNGGNANDLEFPLMNIDQNQNQSSQQFHNPVPVPQAVYYLQPGQMQNANTQNVVYVPTQQQQIIAKSDC